VRGGGVTGKSVEFDPVIDMDLGLYDGDLLLAVGALCCAVLCCASALLPLWISVLSLL